MNVAHQKQVAADVDMIQADTFYFFPRTFHRFLRSLAGHVNEGQADASSTTSRTTALFETNYMNDGSRRKGASKQIEKVTKNRTHTYTRKDPQRRWKLPSPELFIMRYGRK